MTTREAAAYLRISVDYLCRLAGAGTIPAIKVGRAWRFAYADLSKTHVPPSPAPRSRLPVAAHTAPPATLAKTRSPRAARGSHGMSLRERVAAIDPYADLKQAP